MHELKDFTHIPWPVVGDKTHERRLSDRRTRATEVSRVLADRVLHEQRNIFASIAQRRNVNLGAFETKVQILTKRAFRREFLEIAIRRAHQPHIDALGFIRAKTHDVARLQYAQQLRLHRQRHVADFIKEDRAAIGILKHTFTIFVGSSERAAHVAKELIFKQTLGLPRCVESHESP